MTCKLFGYINIRLIFQEDDDDIITIEDEPTCSTFTSSEHAYSYSKFLIIIYA